ncbi:MAG: class I SAM-dependent methyltransferase [Rhodospirillales bacterium]
MADAASERTLLEHRNAWLDKPSLRAVYHDLYRRMADAMVPGRTLEIGGGTGNLKTFVPDAVSTDIQLASWLDVVCDAHVLPFPESAFDNIVMFDVFHHLERPRLFLEEAVRILPRGGRVIMVEPAMTPVSTFFYHHFHPEPVDMDADPFAVAEPDPDRDPYDSNQAVPSLMFQQRKARLASELPDLELKACKKLSLFVYPLTGGFRPWSLMPSSLVPTLLRVEDALLPILGALMAFRILIVLERR